jgi:hypothetical protein
VLQLLLRPLKHLPTLLLLLPLLLLPMLLLLLLRAA